MIQSQVSNTARLALTDTIIAAKAEKNLSFEQIAQGTGLSDVYVTAALLGQHPLPAEAAQQVANTLGLDDSAVELLKAIPLRGSVENNMPTDPTIYRFYEMMQVYGTTFKALVHELIRPR